MKIVGKHLKAMISGKTDHSAPKVAKLQVQDPQSIIRKREKERLEAEELAKRERIKRNIMMVNENMARNSEEAKMRAMEASDTFQISPKSTNSPSDKKMRGQPDISISIGGLLNEVNADRLQNMISPLGSSAKVSFVMLSPQETGRNELRQESSNNQNNFEAFMAKRKELKDGRGTPFLMQSGRT